MTIVSIIALMFRTFLGFGLSFFGFYMAIEEQHKAASSLPVLLAGIGIAFLGLFVAPYAGDQIAVAAKKVGGVGRRGYDQWNAARRGDPITDELTLPPPTVQVTVNETTVKK